MDTTQLKRDLKVIAISVSSTLFAALLFFFLTAPLNRISALETTVTRIQTDLAGFHQDHEDLKMTVTQQHIETMDAIKGLRQQVLDAAVVAAKNSRRAKESVLADPPPPTTPPIAIARK